MKSISIDKLYYWLDKHILLAQAYTEINDLFFIIKACRLKPYSYFQDKSDKLILHKHWFDEFGNSLYISNKKKIKIVYNDLTISKEYIRYTDLYFGLSLDKVVKISKFAYLCVGVDEDLQEDCALITFLGLDNYLRTYLYLYGEWQQVSPLVLGLSHLKTLAQNRELRHFKELTIKEKTQLPCVAPRQWLTFNPPSKALVNMLEKKHPGLFAFFDSKE